MNEYDYEPVKGLPEHLPDGEYIVWQGAPEWTGIARRVFHLRAVMFYFAVLVAWYFSAQLDTAGSVAAAASASMWTLGLAAGCLGILMLLSWLFARSTLYTLTNRRLVLRFGVAIPMMINLPLEKIESAELGRYGDYGDLSLSLAKGERISYIALWPHARPWHFGEVKPMLRGLSNPDMVTSLLADVVSEGGGVRLGQKTAQPRKEFVPAHVVSTRPAVG
ncbi:MAG: photosynthetic complex putative assembly protein PuhB [Halieaceae bacterium]|jgi:hypothetical protein|nr:photosynthetic complex putative assembly protein PuhB [Halieaceae bacterium]